jgi:hypothetical protein
MGAELFWSRVSIPLLSSIFPQNGGGSGIARGCMRFDQTQEVGGPIGVCGD